MKIMCKNENDYFVLFAYLSIWKTYFMIIALFEFGVGQISRKYGPHKSSQLGLELPSWLDMDYSHQFRYWQVYFKLSVAQALHSSSRLIYMLAYLVLDAVARAAAVEVGMAQKKSFHWIIGPAVHKGAFCQFLFRCIYYNDGNKSTGKETGKTHLCAVDSGVRAVRLV